MSKLSLSKLQVNQFLNKLSQAAAQGKKETRAVDYFPNREALGAQCRDLTINTKQSLLAQFLRIEANNESCCIKIESEKRKSRAAVLIARGQVIGCVYGSLALPQQIFGQEAFAHLVADLSARDVAVSSFYIPENIALAAAAMFHGGKFVATHVNKPVMALEVCIDLIDKSQGPGSVVVLDEKEDPVYLLYVSQGKLVSVNALAKNAPRDRKVKDKESLVKYLEAHPTSQLMANSVSFRHYNLSDDLTFGLNPLKNYTSYKEQSQSFNPNTKGSELGTLLAAQRLKPIDSFETAGYSRWISAPRRNTATKLNMGIAVAHPYRIDPAQPVGASL
jgi:hypothetical protein